jgi:hypothetical protein
MEVRGHFKFEAMWHRFPGYLDAVAEGWRLTLQNAGPFRVLDYKLCSQKFIGSVHLQLAMVREVVIDSPQKRGESSPNIISGDF